MLSVSQRGDDTSTATHSPAAATEAMAANRATTLNCMLTVGIRLVFGLEGGVSEVEVLELV